MIWIGIIIGLFIGANIAIFFLTICNAADQGDRLKKGTSH